ncbi:MAG: hypothetical protein J6K32_00485 [Clostridia bacterium]|nr:hypothetical protein [Clostridia bacterium]
MTLYAKNLRVNRLSGKNHPTWHYKIYLREDHGVGFQMEELQFVRFLADGNSDTKVYDAAEIARINQTSHLNGYGLMMFSEGYTPKDSRPSHPTRLGVMLRGKDDGGQAHAFTMYIPLDPYVQP